MLINCFLIFLILSSINFSYQLHENALKHNIAEPSQPLIIKILEQENSLLIENNLQPRKEKKPSTQIGLSNIRERYRLLGQPLPYIEKTSAYFRVTLPLLSIGKYETSMAN